MAELIGAGITHICCSRVPERWVYMLGAPPATEIFEGVTYDCQRVESDQEGRGVVHWVCIDLTAPDIELYVTPKDPVAVKEGSQYRLRKVGDVATTEPLAVAINATLLKSNSILPQISGGLANRIEPAVSNHVVSHVRTDTYFLWLDDQLMPYMRSTKPLKDSELFSAKWGH